MSATTGAVRAGHEWTKRWAVRFIDAGGWEWKFYFLPHIHRRLQDAQIDFKELVERPDALFDWLRVKSTCIDVAAIILVDQAKERGLDYHGFLDRMIDVMLEPGGPRRLFLSLVAVIVKTFGDSAFGREYKNVPAMLEKEGR